MSENLVDSDQGTQDQGQVSEESRPRLGASLVESESPDSSSLAANGHSEGKEAKQTSNQIRDWTNPEVLRRAKPDEVPQEHQASYRFVKQQEAAFSRQQQELRRQQEDDRRVADERERRYQETISRLGQPQGPAAETKVAAFQRLMNDPNLGADDRKGLQFVHELVQEASAPVEELRAQNQALIQRLDRLEQGFGQVSQREVDQATQRLAGDLQTANETFGEDVVNQYAGLIRQNIGQVDPRTGEKFTIVSMLELWTGQQAQQINAARNGHQQAQQGAKRQAAPRAASARGRSDSGPLSKSEAAAKLEQIFS